MQEACVGVHATAVHWLTLLSHSLSLIIPSFIQKNACPHKQHAHDGSRRLAAQLGCSRRTKEAADTVCSHTSFRHSISCNRFHCFGRQARTHLPAVHSIWHTEIIIYYTDAMDVWLSEEQVWSTVAYERAHVWRPQCSLITDSHQAW